MRTCGRRIPGSNRSCRGEMIFAMTGGGKTMPLDSTPNPDGNVAVYRHEDGYLSCRVVTDGVLKPGERMYMPHFATCEARPQPKTTAVTDKNAAAVARRKPRHTNPSIDGLFELPANVTQLRRSEFPS